MCRTGLAAIVPTRYIAALLVPLVFTHRTFIQEFVLLAILQAAGWPIWLLLIERAGQPGFWQSVTGSVDAIDEPLLQTAARELAEETGIVGAPRYG